MLDKLKKMLTKYKSEKVTMADIYLSHATSLEEVERRQREISRGEAPWQVKFNFR